MSGTPIGKGEHQHGPAPGKGRVANSLPKERHPGHERILPRLAAARQPHALIQVVSAEGGAQAHTDIPQGATHVPREVVPEVTDHVHGLKEFPQPYEGQFGVFRAARKCK
jgi:hypothetical protein